MLAISGVHTFYGNIEALKGVDLDVAAGEIVALIGANGAGKSTLLMTVCGQPQAARGRVLFDGRDITRRAPDFSADDRPGKPADRRGFRRRRASRRGSCPRFSIVPDPAAAAHPARR